MPYKDESERRKYQKKYHKKWYANNKVKRFAEIKKRERVIKDQFLEYKSKKKCERCEESHPRALDFHHMRNKKLNISTMSSDGYSLKSIMAEIEKCRILCANCHRIEHYNQGYKHNQ